MRIPTPVTVKLDFVRRHDGHPILGACVLLMGVAATLALCFLTSRMDAERVRLEGQLWQLRAPAAPSTKGEAEALAAADRLSAQFRRPWERLFLGLERIDIDGVRLSQILPQTGGASRIELSGEADQSEALYGYLRRLPQNGDLHDVYLVQQHWDEASKKIQFQIMAGWEQSAVVSP